MPWPVSRARDVPAKSNWNGCAIFWCPCSKSRPKPRSSTGPGSNCMAVAQGTVGHRPGLRTTIRYRHELHYNLRVPQRWPERQNHEPRVAFLEELHTLRKDPRVELWYGDECGVEGDPRPRRRWSARGSRPQVPYLGEHIRANVIGAVLPGSGEPRVCHALPGVSCLVHSSRRYLDYRAPPRSGAPETSKRRVLILDVRIAATNSALLSRHALPLSLPAQLQPPRLQSFF